MNKKFNLLAYLLISIFTIGISPIFAKEANTLTYMTEDYPPYNFEKDGKLVGIAPDLLKLIWEKMDYEEKTIELLPWARGYKFALTKPNHILMSMTRIEQREKLFKWVGPLAASKYVFISLANSTIDIKNIEDVKKYKVGNIRGDATEQILKSSEFIKENVVSISKINQAVKMLKSNRIDFIAYEEASFFKFLKENNYNSSDFQSKLLLTKVEDYYAFHKDTSDELIRKFQTALDSLQKEHQEILNLYLNIP